MIDVALVVPSMHATPIDNTQLARLLAKLDEVDVVEYANDAGALSQLALSTTEKARAKQENQLATIFRAYSIDAHNLQDFLQDTASLPASLINAVPKRQIEFAAGRWCARQALRQLGYCDSAEIGIGEHRSPIWPQGFIGSISHSQGLALAVVGHSALFDAVGIDLEAILPQTSARSVSSHLACASELALGEMHGLPFAVWVSLLFSAKESLFKALYPAVGRYFHFHDAQADGLNLRQRRLSLRLSQHLSEKHTAGQAYTVRFAMNERNVITRCVLLKA